MKPESRLKDIQIALKLADWFSNEEHVDYNADLSLGHLFVNGKIVFYDSTEGKDRGHILNIKYFN